MASSSSVISLLLLLSTSAVVYGNQESAPPPAHPPHHNPTPPTPPPAHPPPTHTHPPTSPPPAHPPPTHTHPPPTLPPAHPPPTHTHPPPTPPAHPPVKPPVKPPVHPPVKPPSYPPARKYVAVQGVVYCKSCKYIGVDTLTGASPLSGAVVRLQCNNTKQALEEQTNTDKNGYFFFMPQKLTTSAYHKCKVFLVKSPLPTCNVATNLHGGATGAILVPPKKPPSDTKPLPFVLFTVGPFAFEPDRKIPCHY